MMYRTYLKGLAVENHLVKIDTAVSCELEIAALCRREFSKKDGGKALLFTSPLGAKYKIATNLFSSENRVLQLLRQDSFADFSNKLAGFLKKHNSAGSGRRDQGEFSCFGSMDQTDNVDLSRLPALRSWPGEILPYLTLALSVSKHPETGEINLGLYRGQIHSKSQIALNFAPGSGLATHYAAAKKQGKGLPVALILGCDPVYWWAASAPLPNGVDELHFCQNFFFCQDNYIASAIHGLPIPDDAEVVLEGELDPVATCVEGPFGNHTGQYVTRNDCPLLHIRSIQQKEDPIVPATVVGPPPSENVYLGKASECLIREMVKIDFPAVLDLCMPVNTLFHGAAILKVKPASAACHREMIDCLWQQSSLSRSKFILLVDSDVDLLSLEQCWWRGINCLQPGRIYSDAGRVAVDATGIDPATLVIDDPQILQRLVARSGELNI